MAQTLIRVAIGDANLEVEARVFTHGSSMLLVAERWLPLTLDGAERIVTDLMPHSVLRRIPQAALDRDYPLLDVRDHAGGRAPSRDEIARVDTLYRVLRQIRFLALAGGSERLRPWLARAEPHKRLVEDVRLLTALDARRARAPADSLDYQITITAMDAEATAFNARQVVVRDETGIATLQMEEFRGTHFRTAGDAAATNRSRFFDARGSTESLWRTAKSEDTPWNKPLVRQLGRIGDSIQVDSGGNGDCFFQALRFAVDQFAPELWDQYKIQAGLGREDTFDKLLLLRALVYTRYLVDIAEQVEYTRIALQGHVNRQHDSESEIFGDNSDGFNNDMPNLIRGMLPDHGPVDWRTVLRSQQDYRRWVPSKRGTVKSSVPGLASKSAGYRRKVEILAEFVQDAIGAVVQPLGWIEALHWQSAAEALRLTISVWGENYFESGASPYLNLSQISPATISHMHVRLKLLGIRRGGSHYVNLVSRKELPRGVFDHDLFSEGEFLNQISGMAWAPNWRLPDANLEPSQRTAHTERYGPLGRGAVVVIDRDTRVHFVTHWALDRLGAARRRVQHLPDPMDQRSPENFAVHAACMGATSLVLCTGPTAVLFAGLFWNLLDHRAPDAPSVIDRVRYVHLMVRNLLATGAAVYAPWSEGETGLLVVLPQILGFGRGYQIKEEPTLCMSVVGASLALTRHLRDLIVSTAAAVYAAAQCAATLVACFLAVSDYGAMRLNADDFSGVMQDALGITDRTVRSNAATAYETIWRKAGTVALPHVPRVYPLALLLCRAYVEFMPHHFTNTAFFDFACEFMGLERDNTINEDTRRAEPLRTYLALAPTQDRALRAPATDMRFSEAAAAESEFSLRLAFPRVHETEWSRKYLSQRRVVLVGWLTRSTAARLDTFSSPRNEDFVRFLQHTQVASAETRTRADAGLEDADLTFRLRPADLVAARREGRVYLHVAAYAMETNPEEPRQQLWVRNGHGFVDVDAIERPGKPFAFTMWEGPVTTAIAWSDEHDITTDMTYKRTYDVVGTVATRDASLFVVNELTTPLPPTDRPTSMFDVGERRTLVRYVAGVIARIPKDVQRRHSLMYLNFPQSMTIIPNWASMLLPPVGVAAWMLEDRVASKLFDEGLSADEFARIAALAAGSGGLARYARDRFLWIVVQILTPYNKVCYRLDRIDGKGNDQMGYPFANNGDCEDTAQAVVQLVRGLADVRTADPASRLVLDFLRAYEPAMCVLTTGGAAITRGTAGPKGLHMMAALIPRSRRGPIVPLETTGLSYNSFASPEYLLGGAVPEKITRRTRAYAEVCAAANRASTAVVGEFINYGVLADAGSAARPVHHHFYDEFVMATLPGADVGFYDFVGADGRVCVPFFDAVLDGRWTLRRIDTDAAALREVVPLVRRFANNVQPTPSFATLERSDAATRPPVLPAPATAPTDEDLLAVRSVCFFANTDVLANAREEMDALYAALSGPQRPAAAAEVTPPEFVAVLGGAITYYVVRVRLV